MKEIISPILAIVASTLHLIEEKQRTKFMRTYHSLLTDINEMENRNEDDYDDGKLDVLYMELRDFLKAYSSELAKQDFANKH